MIAVLSPAKKLAEPQELTKIIPSSLLTAQPSPLTKPALIKPATVLAKEFKKQSPQELSTLLNISEKLSKLNYTRWQEWQPVLKNRTQTFYPAGYLFQGDVYVGLDLKTLTISEVKKLNEIIFILSGLYGALRPLDLIMPYRLEMGTELKNMSNNNTNQLIGIKNLVSYWDNQVAKLINKDLNKNNILLNLASEEYFSVLKPHLSNELNIIEPVFYDLVNGKYQMVSFYAKKARGLVARYLAKTWKSNKSKSVDTALAYLKEFNLERYYFNYQATSSHIKKKSKNNSNRNIHYLVFYRDH